MPFVGRLPELKAGQPVNITMDGKSCCEITIPMEFAQLISHPQFECFAVWYILPEFDFTDEYASQFLFCGIMLNNELHITFFYDPLSNVFSVTSMGHNCLDQEFPVEILPPQTLPDILSLTDMRMLEVLNWMKKNFRNIEISVINQIDSEIKYIEELRKNKSDSL